MPLILVINNLRKFASKIFDMGKSKLTKKAAPKAKPAAKKVVAKAKPAAKKTVAKPTAKKVAAKPAKKVVKPVAKKAAKPVAKKVVAKPVKKVAAKPAAKKVVAKPVKKAVAKPVAKKVAAKPTKKVAPKAVKKVVKPVAKKATPKPVAKKVSKPVVKKAAAKPTKVVAKPVAKKATKPAPKPVAKKVVAKAAPAPAKKVAAAKPVAAAKAKPAVAVKQIEKNTVQPSASKQKQKIMVSTSKAPTTTLVNNEMPAARYSDDDLKAFKELIEKKLEVAREELKDLKGSLDSYNESLTGNKSWNMEEGSDTSDMEYMMNQISRQHQYLRNLEAALVRIENKTYGICRVTGKLIPKERLRLVPHATLSVEAKQSRKPEDSSQGLAHAPTAGSDEIPTFNED